MIRFSLFAMVAVFFLLSHASYAADKPKHQTLGETQCNVGEVLKFDGSLWECATDQDSTGVDWSNISNIPSDIADGDQNTDTLATLSCNNGEIPKSDGGGGWGCAEDDTTTPVTSTDTLATLDCSEGDVARFNGLEWECSGLLTALINKVSGKKVFVSSELLDGNFGGLNGADATCQQLANAVGLGGKYRAWLSDSTGSPSSRFIQSSNPYVLVDGSVLASNWADFTDGELAQPIGMDESGVILPIGVNFGAQVWSNTKEDGTLNLNLPGAHCNGWTAGISSSGATGTIGAFSAAGTPTQGEEIVTGSGLVRLGWTRIQAEFLSNPGTFGEALRTCNTNARIYCVQQ